MDKQQHKHKKITFDFPAEEYVYLKMACAKQGVSMKDFITKSVVKTIEEYEDELDLMAFREAYTEENIKNAIPLDQLKKELALDKEQ